MKVKALTRISPTWIFYIAIASVFVLGVLLRFVLASQLEQHFAGTPEQEHPAVETIRGVGEAFIVAAILAGVVDPYAKFRLGKEVGREIAKETAGEHLPEELRQALEGIQDIKLYIRRMAIDCTLEEVESNPNLLKWRMTMHYEVENASWKRRAFKHRLTIPDEELNEARMQITEVAHKINGKRKYRLKGTDDEFKAMCHKQPPFIIFSYAHPTKIRSTRLGDIDRCEYHTSTERRVPVSEIQVIQFTLPTIGVVLTVRHPPGVKVETSLEHIDGATPEPPEGETADEVSRWKSDRAYLGNEHLWVMYERQNESDLKDAPASAPIGVSQKAQQA